MKKESVIQKFHRLHLNYVNEQNKQWCLTKLNGVCEATGLQFDLSVEGISKKMNPFAPSID